MSDPTTHIAGQPAPTEMKLVLAFPTAGLVRAEFAFSLATLVGSIAARGFPTRPECSVSLQMDVVHSSVIHTNREQLVRRAIDAGNTHLLFIDDDMSFDPRAVEILAGRRHPIVAVNYVMKSETPTFLAVGLDGNHIVTGEHSTGIVPAAYTGFGLALFDLDAFRKTPQPWFQPTFLPKTSEYTTEDNPCYAALRASGHTVYVDHSVSQVLALYNADQRTLTTILDEFNSAKMIRAVHARNQLQEVLVDFWFNHFNVDISGSFERYSVPAYERDAIRSHVLGRFRDLLGATAAHPAMLYYLDNYLSRLARAS